MHKAQTKIDRGKFFTKITEFPIYNKLKISNTNLCLSFNRGKWKMRQQLREINQRIQNQ